MRVITFEKIERTKKLSQFTFISAPTYELTLYFTISNKPQRKQATLI